MAGSNGGDIMRWAGSNPDAAGPGMGPLFMMYNKNKRSVALDLKRAEDQEACVALARTCDVVCSNMRMDTAARLKMDYESLKAQVPNVRKTRPACLLPLTVSLSTAFEIVDHIADRVVSRIVGYRPPTDDFYGPYWEWGGPATRYAIYGMLDLESLCTSLDSYWTCLTK